MFIAIGLIVAGIIFMLASAGHKRTVARWQTAAAELGLDTTVGGRLSRPVLTGRVDGHRVEIDSYTHHAGGNNNQTYTRYRVGFDPLGIELRLSRQGVFSAITKMFGQQDVEVGDAAFDAAFIVQSSDPNRLRGLLTPSVRSGLLRLLASYPDTVVHDDYLVTTRRGVERDPARIVATSRRLVAIARLLQSPGRGVSDEMVTERATGDLSAAAERARRLVEAEPDDIDARLFEIETLAAAGDDDAAARRVRELDGGAAVDPEVAGWRETLQHATPQPERGELAGSAADFASDLFGGTDLSFETRTKFNERYVGKSVRWTGTVKDVAIEPSGTRATIAIATISNDLYGNTEVDLVAVLSSGAGIARGDEVTVHGELATIDPLLRNVFVTGAELVPV
jgi:hypothetical protein